MKNIIITTIFFLFITVSANSQNWNNEMFANHTYKSFEKLTQANQLIDFEALDLQLLNAAIFFETNRQREINGFARYGHSIVLEKSAAMHSKDMVEKKFFSHTSKIKSHKTLLLRLTISGLKDYSAIGENIAMTSKTSTTYLLLAKELVDIWMKSPGHRANILNAEFGYLGCGAFFDKNNYVYATQAFADRRGQNDQTYPIPVEHR